MSIPLDRLYHYIESVAQDVYGDTLIYRFFPHGSKNINDLQCIKNHSWAENCYLPHLICYDQEPLHYDLYKDTPVRLDSRFTTGSDQLILPKRNLRVKIGNIYDKCLLLHSEKLSSEVERYQQDQFVPVYYWSHAIIARDWFRYMPNVRFNKNIKKTFLIYNRAWQGTREYRLKFIDLLIDNNLLDYCQTSFNPLDHSCHYKNHKFNNTMWRPNHNLEQYLTPTLADSAYSADINIEDYNNTEFEVVLETLFDDQRHHLTEKILRPIACNQPFLVASTPGVLKYLRDYGFRTFDDIINEDYDLIQDPYKRMQAIISTMHNISSWSGNYKKMQMEKINKITQFNQSHFFSNYFFNTVIQELKDNLKRAFDHVENTNMGVHYRDLKIKHIPGMKQYRNEYILRDDRVKALQKIKVYRKQNRQNK